jgi:folate-binding Fe-S cluster repair protein YgfZ
MDDIDRAVMCQCIPDTDPATLNKAIEFLQTVSTSPSGWKTFLHKLFTIPVETMKIYCLRVLQDLISSERYSKLTLEERKDLRTAMLQYLNSNILNNKTTSFGIKNKFSQVLVLIYKD